MSTQMMQYVSERTPKYFGTSCDAEYIEYVTKAYRRIATIPAHLIVEALQRGDIHFTLDDQLRLSLMSYRIQTYKKGCKCVHCGVEGQYFAVERDRKSDVYHLNVYYLDNGGNEHMITSDHMIAKSVGGSNLPENRQPMCKTCNTTKAHFASVEEGIAAKEEFKRLRDAEEINFEEKLQKLLNTQEYCLGRIEQGTEAAKWRRVWHNREKDVHRIIHYAFGIRILQGHKPTIPTVDVQLQLV